MKHFNSETDIPESLQNAYYKMLEKGVRVRTALDEDYAKVKDTGRFESLDKLQKK